MSDWTNSRWPVSPDDQSVCPTHTAPASFGKQVIHWPVGSYMAPRVNTKTAFGPKQGVSWPGEGLSPPCYFGCPLAPVFFGLRGLIQLTASCNIKIRLKTHQKPIILMLKYHNFSGEGAWSLPTVPPPVPQVQPVVAFAHWTPSSILTTCTVMTMVQTNGFSMWVTVSMADVVALVG